MLGRLREVIRLRHYAKSTEQTYLHWTRRFLAYRRRAGGEGEPTSEDARAFLTRLAMAERVSSSTQNQAFSAILLFFREVLRTDLDGTILVESDGATFSVVREKDGGNIWSHAGAAPATGSLTASPLTPTPAGPAHRNGSLPGSVP